MRALDYFYPGRLAAFAAWKSDKLQTTPLRETLDRQSGMYRVAAKISDLQIDDLVAGFCRSRGGRFPGHLLGNPAARGGACAKIMQKKIFPPAHPPARP